MGLSSPTFYLESSKEEMLKKVHKMQTIVQFIQKEVGGNIVGYDGEIKLDFHTLQVLEYNFDLECVRYFKKLAEAFHYNITTDFLLKKLDKNITRMNNVWDKLYSLGPFNFLEAINYLYYSEDCQVKDDVLIIFHALERCK